MGETPTPTPHELAQLVLRAVEDIDTQDDEGRDALLSALLSAAWGDRCGLQQ